MDVRASSLTVTRAGRMVLDGVSFRIGAGQRVLLAGPSGSGKSTLLMAMAGLLAEDPAAHVEGRVRLGGADITAKSRREIAASVGYLFQETESQMITDQVESEILLRNALLGIRAAESDVVLEAKLRRYDLAAFATRPLASLSGGEARRAALASLPEGAGLLLLDEPLNGLDREWREATLAAIAGASAGRTMVFAEHRWRDVLPHVDRVVALEHGRIVFDGEANRFRLPPAPALRRDRPTASTGDRLRLVGSSAKRGAFLLGPVDVAFPNGVTLLAGDNGCGKTTLLETIAGLVRTSAGRVELDGKTLPEPGSGSRGGLVGLVTQRSEEMLFAGSVREEIGFGPRNFGVAGADGEFTRALGLEDLFERHPGALSGGERQRVAIAAALAHDPPVMLFDEPTVGLDAAALDALACLISARRGSRVIIVATHDERLRPLADRVLTIEGGRVLQGEREVVVA